MLFATFFAITFYGVCISRLIRSARAYGQFSDFNNRNKISTAKALKRGYSYHNVRKIFSKVYRRHSK